MLQKNHRLVFPQPAPIAIDGIPHQWFL